VLPALKDIQGYRGGYVFRSDGPREVEFVVVNLFDSQVSSIYYGWPVLVIAALAMVGTLPGRTQGLTALAPVRVTLGWRSAPLLSISQRTSRIRSSF